MGDSTLPTHVHDDMHFPDDDAFEDWMSEPNLDNEILTADEQDAVVAAGPIQLPPGDPFDRLFFLLHTTNQIADFFSSDDVNGDAVDPLGFVQSELDVLAATIASPRVTAHLTDNDVNNSNEDGDLGRIRQASYLRRSSPTS